MVLLRRLLIIMEQRTVIIHGWSDVGASFQKLKLFLQSELQSIVDDIYFYDYESREDNVTYNDVAYGLHTQLIEQGLLNQDGSSNFELNIIVHSTGGLVIRHWLTSFYFKSQTLQCPIKRIVMLAPANFGSPLAKAGKSFIGALATAKKDLLDMADFFETGQQILDGLELGSSFQWQLAHKDLLSAVNFYSPDTIQTTVLVGIEDYKDLMRSFVNKPGTDGTIVISGAPLDVVKFKLDFANAKYSWLSDQSISQIAFGVFPKVNHSSIVDSAATSKSLVANAILTAFQTKTSADFEKLKLELAETTAQTYKKYPKIPKYEQFLVHAVDDFGLGLSDFTLEFFVAKKKDSDQSGADNKHIASIDFTDLTKAEQNYSKRAMQILCCEFETFTKDRSFRRFLVDVQELRKLLVQAQKSFEAPAVLYMKVWVPPVDKGITYNIKDLKALKIMDSDEAGKPIPEFSISDHDKNSAPSLWYENTTTLIELQINRVNRYTWLKPKGMTKQERSEHIRSLT